MSDKQEIKPFDPEFLSLLDIKLMQGNVDVPDTFDSSSIKSHEVINQLIISLNNEEGLAKADFTVSIKTISEQEQSEASTKFKLNFLYHVKHLKEYASYNETTKSNEMHPYLANAIASISYSTARGILLSRLQGTPFQNFILKVINPNSLIG